MIKALGSTPNKDSLVMYIHDTKIRQTQGPFTLWSDTIPLPWLSTSNRLLPVFDAVQQDEPRFLIVDWHAPYSARGYPDTIDLRALNNSSSQKVWSRFSLPGYVPEGTDLDPNCRSREADKMLLIAGIASGVFGIAMLVFLYTWRRRKRRLKVTIADQNSSQAVQDEELELESRFKDAKAPIQDDARP